MRPSIRARNMALLLIASTQLGSPSVARADMTCVDLFYRSPFVKVRDSDALRLENKDGSVAVFPANSYYRETRFREVVDFVLARRADVQARMDEALTNGHARNGNTFQKKNPATGHYDIEFAPRVSGAIVPLEKAFFDQQIESMAPVARSLRFLLQRIYSSGDLFTRYKSQDAATKQAAFAEIVKYLEIDGLPVLEQRRLVDIVADSVYFETAMIDSNLKDYGFLPVIGFDAAIDTLQRVTAIYYEFNSGTPSGLSNNIQLLELVRQKDPALYAKFKDQILDDKTFEVLREAIESNARQYTGQADGISVIIGPGSFNAANPDVAAISTFSGMPLVKSQDLYQGRDGFVYLDTGRGEKHPKVTGIYGRVEESAFLNSAKDGIGWILPELKDNVELGRKWGTPLRNGVEYVWKKNEKGEKVGVETDSAGKPLVAQYSLGQIGRDPSRPNTEPSSSFASLIRSKKLYFSGLGGRVIDDKRVFEIINRHLAHRFKTPGTKAPTAGPPRTLTEKEVGEFYAHPEKFVVKVPDESGGVGVYLGPLLSRAELDAVVQKVKTDRADAKRTGRQPVLTIQDFTTAAVMTTPVQEGKGWKWGTTVPDWRFFVFMDANGGVRAGTNSFLVRAAKRLSPSTNTSQGAGYGIGVILDPAGQRTRDPGRTVLPAGRASLPLTRSSKENLTKYFDAVREVMEIAYEGPTAEVKLREVAPVNPYLSDSTRSWNRLEVLVQLHKEVISELGLESSQFMTTLKKFNSGEITLAKFRQDLKDYRTTLLSRTNFQHRGVDRIVADTITNVEVPGLRATSSLRPKQHTYFNVKSTAAHAPLDFATFLREHVTLEAMAPKVLRETSWFGRSIEIVQVGRVIKTTDQVMNGFIAELGAVGGTIRYVRQRAKSGELLESPPSAEFGVDREGRPVIDIDLNQNQLLTGIAHEMVHFRDWLGFYREELAKGAAPIEAAKTAVSRSVDDIDFQRSGETRAVRAEMEMEKQNRPTVFNSGAQVRPTRFWQTVGGLSYASRILYPDITAVARTLHKIRWEKYEPPTSGQRLEMAVRGRTQAEKYLTSVILGAADIRGQTIGYLRGVHEKYAQHPDATVRRRANEARAEADRVAETSLFDYVMRVEERNVFTSADTLDLVQRAFASQVERLVREGRLTTDVALAGTRSRVRASSIEEQLLQQQQQQQQ
ncbi:MAG: circularly permuted type 2 ATP-grasp protein [Bdellovibrionota bacterium]